MSAVRERGLSSDDCRNAEPQSCEGQLKRQERQTDTMKTYLLRDSKAVQPQRPARSLRTQTRRSIYGRAPGRESERRFAGAHLMFSAMAGFAGARGFRRHCVAQHRKLSLGRHLQ